MSQTAEGRTVFLKSVRIKVSKRAINNDGSGFERVEADLINECFFQAYQFEQDSLALGYHWQKWHQLLQHSSNWTPICYRLFNPGVHVLYHASHGNLDKTTVGAANTCILQVQVRLFAAVRSFGTRAFGHQHFPVG